MTLLAAALFALWGWREAQRVPLDALPDLSDVQVIVMTDWPGRSPDLVEAQVTQPLTTALLSAPGVKVVRGQSSFGLSFVYAIFEDGTDLYWARTRVSEYMARAQLPQGVKPVLGPDASGVGWVLMYALVDESGQRDLQELRALQDWTLRYGLESVEGVAEVAPLGGAVKQYQVQVDPEKLRRFGVSLQDVVEAVEGANVEVEGGVTELAGHEYMVRGRGYARGVEDFGASVVMPRGGGAPVRVRDVAEVVVGAEGRRGVAEWNGGGEVVGGIVVMRSGQNALRVIEGAKAKMEALRPSLPPGVKLEVMYDRSELIEAAVETLRSTLLEELLVVSAIIFFFLLHARSALVPVLSLPIAVGLSFIPMSTQGVTANIMSLGGVAIAIGEIADASIVLIDNIHVRLEEWEGRGRPGSRHKVVVRAMQEVGPSIFYSLAVMTVSFLPVLALEATEGRLFRPLALTKTWSMGFAAALAVTMTPALAALVVRGKIRAEAHNPVHRLLVWLYAPVVRWVVERRWWVLAGAAALMAFTVPAWGRLGHEFMPPLHEGSLLYMPTAPPGMSVTEAARVLQRMDAALKEVPEVRSVFGKMGRASTATDPAPLSMAETTILLAPKEEWRDGLTWDGLVKELDQRLQVPGMPNLFWMPVQTRTSMLSTGVRSPLAVQVEGGDLATLERAAIEVERRLKEIPGTRAAFAERSAGGFYLDVTVEREEAARLGLRVKDVHEALQAAVGGVEAGQVVEGRERYGVQVRYARDFRAEPEQIERVLVRTPTGELVPLGRVAKVASVQGPDMLRSEDGALVSYVFVDLDEGVPVASYVEQARAAVERDVALPQGVRLSWVGQYEAYERAGRRLATLVPLTLLLVALLLYLNTRSWTETVVVMLAVPFSAIGAVWLMYLLGYPMSVASWVGMIALAGLDAETGVVMLLYLTMAWGQWSKEGRLKTREDLKEAIVEGAARRIRPKLMTMLTTLIGLMPLMWSDGTGADVMRRMAAPMLGGLATSFALELLVYPALFAIWKGWGLKAAQPPPATITTTTTGQDP